jgi:hypothetical protein
MPTLTERLAGQVIASFRAELAEETQTQIGTAQFERLELLVEDALSTAIHDAAERVEAVVRELRSDTSSPQLDL